MNKNLLNSILLGALIVGIYFLFFYEQNSSKNKTIKNTNLVQVESGTEIDVIEDDVDEEIKILESEVARLNDELRYLASVFPTEANIPQLLKDLSSIGDSSGLQFLLFEPVETVNEGVYEEIPIKLKLRGTYKQLAMFFAGLTRLNRVIKIENLKITGPVTNTGYVMTETELLLITYRMIGGV